MSGSTDGEADGPLVSIIIPTRNRAAMLDRCVRSARAQSHLRVEVIVVDDASEPPAHLGEPADGVVLIRLDANLGTSGARNAGLAVATGEYVAFVDDDDELLPGFVDVSLKALRTTDLPAPVAALSCMEHVGEAGTVVGERLAFSLPRGSRYDKAPQTGRSAWCHNTLLVPTDVIRRIGGFDDQLAAYEYEDLFIRLLDVCSLQAVDAITYRYRHHRGPRQSGRWELAAYSAAQRAEKFSGRPDFPRSRLAKLELTATRYYLLAGRRRPAIGAAVRALRARPSPRTGAYLALLLAGPRAFEGLQRLRLQIRRP